MLKTCFFPFFVVTLHKDYKIMKNIQNGVFRLTKDSSPMEGVEFKAGQEFELIGGVIYMGGFPLQLNFQNLIKTWMDKNPTLFENDTRDF